MELEYSIFPIVDYIEDIQEDFINFVLSSSKIDRLMWELYKVLKTNLNKFLQICVYPYINISAEDYSQDL